MRLVYKFTYNGLYKQRIFDLCNVSRCLYNQALYLVKKELENNNKWLFYNDTNKIMQNTTNLDNKINYKLLKAQCSQQCLRQLDKNIKSYIKSIKDWSKNKEKYKGKPSFPKYKKTYNMLIFTSQCCVIRNKFIFLYKDLSIPIPQYEKYKNKLNKFQQVRVIPKENGKLIIEIIYEQECKNKKNNDRIASIDLGIDNIVSMVTSDGNATLYNGKQIKSINQWMNKIISKAKSECEKINKCKTSKKIKRLYEKRENIKNDLFHKLSKDIVNKLDEKEIGTLVVGYNKEWKQGVNLGHKTNQTFVQIPFNGFIEKLRYKCELLGIDFILQEESYTSKCDSLAKEEIVKHEVYFGRRVKRGLFQSSTKKLINADINGALNIMRKVVGDSCVDKILNSGLLFNPIKYNNIFLL